jgi:hypothetical protein
MQELLFINPHKRGTKVKKRAAKKRTFSPAQRAAQRKFAAMARARGKAARSKNPSKGKTMAKKRRTSRASPARRKTRRTVAVRRANPVKRHRRRAAVKVHRRRRHNPISMGSLARPMSLVKSAFTGALGAVAVNTVLNKLPLPTALTTGYAVYATRGAAAIALGMLAHKLGVAGGTAAKMAEGALTVTLHDAIVNIAGSAMPTFGLAGAGFIANKRMGAYLPPNRMGAYLGPATNSNVRSLAGMGNKSYSFRRAR